MANQILVGSDTMSSSEYETMKSSLSSFVVVDSDAEEDVLSLIENLTGRVEEMNGALAESQAQERETDNEKEQLRSNIRLLEDQNTRIESSFQQRIASLERQLEESKDSTLTTAASMKTVRNSDHEQLTLKVDELTMENTELKELLESSKSSSKLLPALRNKTEELKEKKKHISDLEEDIMQKEQLVADLQEEQRVLRKERDQLMKEARSKGSGEELRAKEERIKELEKEKEDLEALYAEEQETASNEKEELQQKIARLERSGRGGSIRDSSANLRELRSKEERIKELEKEKEDLETFYAEEQENARKEKEELEQRISRLERSGRGGSVRDSSANLEERVKSLQKQLTSVKKIYEEQMEDMRKVYEEEKESLTVQLTRDHEKIIQDLRKQHEEEKESLTVQLTRDHEKIIQDLRKQRSGDADKEELGDLKKKNEHLERRLEEYEVNTNKLVKKKADLLQDLRQQRQEKARLETELIVMQKQMVNDSETSEELERLKEDLMHKEDDIRAYIEKLGELSEKNIFLTEQIEKVERQSSSRPGKDNDELLQIYAVLHRLSGKREEKKSDKKNHKALMETVHRLALVASRSFEEQNELVKMATKEKEFQMRKRKEAEEKLVEGKIQARQQLEEACKVAKEDLAVQFAEHANYQRQFIEFLQMRLELVTSPFFQQRLQPVPAYNGCSHYVGQPLPQP